MTKIISIALLLVGMSTASFAHNGDPVNKEIASSEITWKGYKVAGNHAGTVDLTSGMLQYDEAGALIGGNFVLDMTSIACTDLEGEYKGKLEGHLKSDDFFGVETNPTAALEITKVASRGKDGEYKVVADLTIKGKTNPVKFNVRTSNGAHIAQITVDRSEYDVRYGSGSFFEKLGDNTIYDEFEISVYLQPAK